MWTPIKLEEILAKISDSESVMEPQVRAFWELVKVVPRKWAGGEYGKDGGGFWVVAVLGNRVIWYNDIEEGFNVSAFEEYGTIKELWCNQSELHWEVRWLWQNMIDRLSSGTSSV
jgi:hypothetical protein